MKVLNSAGRDVPDYLVTAAEAEGGDGGGGGVANGGDGDDDWS